MAEGFFRSKKGFTVVQNEITRDNTISLKAKGLYLVIQAYITMPDKKWTKEDFLNLAKEGRKAFDTAWQELKDNGYLKVHFMPDNGKWRAEYELLDEPDPGPHTLYYNSSGEVSSDNIQRAEKKHKHSNKLTDAKECRVDDETMENDRYPHFGSNAGENDRYPRFGSNGNGINGQGSNANGVNNNKTVQINTGDKSCHIDSNQNPYQQEVMEQYPMEYLKKLYRANDLIVMGISDADVEMAMDILYDAVNTTKKTIRVNREDKPSEVVRSRLLKLRCMDIMYAIEQYHKQTTEIRYQKAYMLSILYDARGQGHLDYSNQVQHDLYGYGGGGG
ncbi:MAG: hypothetical protein HFG35_04930 [Eubacterium sp.]|jgi:hypothetical protein|nr:hypothetical protein [Eubacterium sp.]